MNPHPPQPPQSPPIRMLVHFKNSMHDGYFSTNLKRQGPGITIMDGGLPMLGYYKNDQNFGHSLIFLTFDIYAIVEFNKGALDGPFVMRGNSFTIYSVFVNNRLQGELLYIDYEQWVAQVWNIDQSGTVQITKQLSLTQTMNSYLSYTKLKQIQNPSTPTPSINKSQLIQSQPTLLQKLTPHMQALPNIANFIKIFKLGNNQFSGLGTQIFVHRVYAGNQIVMLGGAEGGRGAGGIGEGGGEFLGVGVNKRQQLIACGIMTQLPPEQSQKDRNTSFLNSYILNGLGLLIQQQSSSTPKTIQTGQFQNNRLHGQGCKHIVGQKAIYGKYIDGGVRTAQIMKIGEQKDDEMRKLELKRVKNVHMHSLKFHNNYANQRPIYILLDLVQMVPAGKK